MKHQKAVDTLRYAWALLRVRIDKDTTARIVPEDVQADQPPLLVIYREGEALKCIPGKSQVNLLGKLAAMLGPWTIDRAPTCPYGDCQWRTYCNHAIDRNLFLVGYN